jgi:NAD(P)-dependent dehydrogenase (short-subunit alcohol dehydrogenase family)
MRLSESVVVLTGASGGIGLELAEQLCAAGAQVLAVSRHMGKLAGLMSRYPDRLRWQRPTCAASRARTGGRACPRNGLSMC